MPTIFHRWECAVALVVSLTISIHTLTDSSARKAMSGSEAFLAVSTCDTNRPRSVFFDSYQPALSNPQEEKLWIRHFSTQAHIQPITNTLQLSCSRQYRKRQSIHVHAHATTFHPGSERTSSR